MKAQSRGARLILKRPRAGQRFAGWVCVCERKSHAVPAFETRWQTRCASDASARRIQEGFPKIRVQTPSFPSPQVRGGGSVCRMIPTRNVSLFIQSCQDVTSGLTAGEAPRRDERRFAGEATDLGAGEGERPVDRPREDPTGRPGLLERALPPFFGMIVTGAGRQTERTRSLGPTLTPYDVEVIRMTFEKGCQLLISPRQVARLACRLFFLFNPRERR